jgi:hypothetical protein
LWNIMNLILHQGDFCLFWDPRTDFCNNS